MGNLNSTAQQFYKETWNQVIRAYETLTDEDKFENFLYYGNPEGSMIHKAMDVAIPDIFLSENNQLFSLIGIFATVIMIPAVIISRTADNEVAGDYVDDYTPEAMSTMLMQIIDKNLAKKVECLKDD